MRLTTPSFLFIHSRVNDHSFSFIGRAHAHAHARTSCARARACARSIRIYLTGSNLLSAQYKRYTGDIHVACTQSHPCSC